MHASILEDLDMGPDLDTLATALYVRIDDLLADNPDWAPKRPRVGIAPRLTDAELVTLAVISALLGYDNESQFVRFAKEHLRPWFPYMPNRDGYNKRLRGAAGTIARVTSALARECASWHDDVWLVDSTPVECGTSRETVKMFAGSGLSACDLPQNWPCSWRVPCLGLVGVDGSFLGLASCGRSGTSDVTS